LKILSTTVGAAMLTKFVIFSNRLWIKHLSTVRTSIRFWMYCI